MTTLIILKEMNDIIKIVKSLQDAGLLIKGVSEIIETQAKEENCEFLGMLLGTLGANLSGNL